MNFIAGASILVVCVAALVKAEYTKEELAILTAYSNECVKETKVPIEMVAALDKYQLAEGEAMAEYLFCFGKKYGGMTEAGGFNKDVVKKDFETEYDTETAAKLTELCTAKDEGDGKKNAVVFTQCFFDNAPKKDKQ